VKYFKRGRDADDDIVVVPNHGAFRGLMVEIGDGFETRWLREWSEISQSYANDARGADATYSNEVITEYAHPDLGLQVRARALATEADNVFVLRVRMIRQGNSPIDCGRLVAVQNLGLVTEKVPQYPSPTGVSRRTTTFGHSIAPTPARSKYRRPPLTVREPAIEQHRNRQSVDDRLSNGLPAVLLSAVKNRLTSTTNRDTTPSASKPRS